MGKYIVTISGTDRKNEIISETYQLNKWSEDIKSAVIEIYNEEWSYYSPYNIEVNVTDLEAALLNFKCDNKITQRIENKIYNKKIIENDEKLNEIELLKQLKEKYPEV
jgi:hypothetical protein